MDPGAEMARVLTQNAAVTALIGTRVYPIVMPETSQWPLGVYRRTGSERDRVLAGPARVAHTRYEVGFWARKNDELEVLLAAGAKALDGYQGVSTDGLPLAIGVLNDQVVFDETTGLYHGTLDVTISHEIAA
jgi:hypothetical protein